MSDNDCVFCKIIAGAIPSEKLYEDDEVLAFEDINPLAPVHFLVIPKEHVETLDEVGQQHEQVLGKMMLVATSIAREKGASESGYRQVINCGKSAGQLVYHLHIHIIGGRDLAVMG